MHVYRSEAWLVSIVLGEWRLDWTAEVLSTERIMQLTSGSRLNEHLLIEFSARAEAVTRIHHGIVAQARCGMPF